MPDPAHPPVPAADRDDTTLLGTAPIDRGATNTPPAPAAVDLPGILLAPEMPVLPGDAQHAQALVSRSHATECSHGTQLQETDRIATNSDPQIHSDGIVDPNSAQTISDTENTAENGAPFPLINAKDYKNDVEFSGMYQYLLNGTPVSYTHLTLPTILRV